MKDTFDEMMSEAEALTAQMQRERWAKDQRRMLDHRRRIRSGHVEPQRPACKVLPLVRRTA